MKAIKINPQFEDLQQPETLLNHVQEITETKVDESVNVNHLRRVKVSIAN